MRYARTKSEIAKMKELEERYKKSEMYSLCDCYGTFSQAKENAFNYWKRKTLSPNCSSLKILSFNDQNFTVAFYENNNEKIHISFCNISKSLLFCQVIKTCNTQPIN